MSSGRFTGKVALVTGAASGIGKETALRLAQECASLALVDINQHGVEETGWAAREWGGDVATFAVDLRDEGAVRRLFGDVIDRFQRLDVLINVAGGSGRRFGDGPVDACTVDGWEKTLELNLKTTFLTCKYAIPYLLKQPRSVIVNVSSVLGMVGGGEHFATHAYAASKAAIIGLSRAMAVHYAPRGLRVNVVAPGLIQTPMSRRAQSDPTIRALMKEKQPLIGSLGQPEEVASAIVFLASDEASLITGAVLPADGGWTAQ